MAKGKQAKKTAEAVPHVPPPAMALPVGIKAVRQVIVPTLSLKVNEPHTFRINDAMRVSSYKDPDPKKAQKPATVCGVTKVDTGEMFILLCPAVLESALREGYPGDGYIGKAFYVQKLPKRPGKRYFDIQVVEVETE